MQTLFGIVTAWPGSGIGIDAMLYLFEQALNGIQLGMLLFLLAGLTLIFGTMGLVNLAHGSPYMLGA